MRELNAAPVVSVGNVPGGEDQHDERQELRQRDEAQVEWVPGGAEDLPADSHGLDLRRQPDEEPRRQVSAQVGVAKDDEPVLRRFVGHRRGA